MCGPLYTDQGLVALRGAVRSSKWATRVAEGLGCPGQLAVKHADVHYWHVRLMLPVGLHLRRRRVLVLLLGILCAWKAIAVLAETSESFSRVNQILQLLLVFVQGRFLWMHFLLLIAVQNVEVQGRHADLAMRPTSATLVLLDYRGTAAVFPRI